MTAKSNPNRTALSGVRVLDLTNLLAGPFPSLLLALLGAEVIKIESEAQLDAARRPPYAYDDPDASPVFNTINLNKLSVQLNLKEPEAIRLVHGLVSISDAVVENMRPGVMDRLGLGYQQLGKINPTLVFASITGAGGTGPESSYPGYAPAFNALSGLGHLTGYPDGPPGELHDSIDCRVGATAAFAILSGLFHRLRTGEGQFIDLSSRESIAMFTGEALMDFSMNGNGAGNGTTSIRRGNRSPGMAPHGCYPCKGQDAWVTIAVSDDTEWQAFCGAIGHPEWISEPEFRDSSLRQKNQETLDLLIGDWTQTKSPNEATKLLQSAGVAAAPSMTRPDLANDPHLIARGAWQRLEHPVLGRQTVQGPPWILSETPASIHSPSPLLGQHNEYVLQGLLGASKAELAEWLDAGVLN
ncbi:MAG: hypothetical protein BZY81_03845 [SAR202 cluster bacterium Io17-Chloro-G4]|nr:MAG: hypothetical protein BZY81_03845 [SAR202 cluster bacterium Io17-Chloro-G4]